MIPARCASQLFRRSCLLPSYQRSHQSSLSFFLTTHPQSHFTSHHGSFSTTSSSSSSARVIDGRKVALELREEMKVELDGLYERFGRHVHAPGLAVVLVGHRPDSEKYVAMKKRAADELGFFSVEVNLPETVTTEEVLQEVEALNRRADVDGILVQLPLPEQVDQTVVLEAIEINKDVDGFHSSNFGNLARMGEDLRRKHLEFVVTKARNAACTPLGAIVLLERSGVDIAGKNAVVLGRSNIVGLPVALMLLHRNATVTMCHSHTTDLEDKCRQADIIIAAIGRAEFVKASFIKPGATVIDVGINFKEDSSKKSGYKMVGDVAFDEVSKVAGAITPVPGGVGPLTVAMLMMNCLNNAKIRMKRESSAMKLAGQVSSDRFDAQFVKKLRKSPSFAWKYGTSAREP